MKDFSLSGGISFGHVFYTTAMVYDRREQEPFPPVNVYFCRNRILVQALLPGLELKDIRITLDRQSLLIEGCIERARGRYVHEERYSGHFCRRLSLDLSEFRSDSVTITNGILQIELKKRI